MVAEMMTSEILLQEFPTTKLEQKPGDIPYYSYMGLSKASYHDDGLTLQIFCEH